jgi:RHS repeat-associated protein
MKAIKAGFITLLLASCIFFLRQSVYSATDIVDISNPSYVTVNPLTNQALITSERSDTLLIVDLKTKAVLSTIPVGRKPGRIAVAPGLNIALVSSRYDNALSIVDLNSNQVTAVIPVGKSPEGIALKNDPHLAFVANNVDDSVSVIDLDNLRVIKTFAVGKGPKDIAVDPQLKLALIVNEGDANVSVVDTGTFAVTGLVPVGKKPCAIGVNPETRLAVTVNEKDNSATIIDLTNWQTAPIPLDKHPIGIAVNQLDNSALVICDEARSLLHIDLSTRGIIDRYALNKRSWGVAVNQYTNMAVVVDDKTDSVSLMQLPNPLPQINSITPSTVFRGSGPVEIMIEGSGFITTSAVSSLQTDFIDNHHLKAIFPKDLLTNTGSYELFVTNPPPRGGASNSVDLRIDNPTPALNVLDPAEAMAGTPGLIATVYGTGFLNDITTYYVNDIPRAATMIGPLKIQIPLTPLDLEIGRYLEFTAQNPPPGGGTSNTLTLTVSNPVPTLSSLYPASVKAGSPNLTLTLTGNNFVKTTNAFFGNNPVQTTYISSSRVEIFIPANAISTAGSYPVRIGNPAPGGGVSGTLPLTVTKASTVEPLPDGAWGKQYEDLIPADATINKYDSRRFAIITGQIRDRTGSGIAGMAVAIQDHPEYGTTQTDSTGNFSIPVEGGGIITIVYQKAGFITSHRQVNVSWNNIAIVEYVSLIPEDTVATTVPFNGNPATITTHRSSTTTDAFGSRSLTMVFTGDNRAFAKDAQGNEVGLTSITTRATEFAAPESMPAKLPPNSAYTYCAELSAEGVKNVRFEKPVAVYIDNFLGFNVGEVVPVGYYDRDRAVWVPSNNGIVVRLLDTNGDGIVDAFDNTGDGNPHGTVTGLDDPSAYKPNSTYWRIEVDHFTPWDCNWPYGPPPDAIAPNPRGEPSYDKPEKDCDLDCIGSYVERRNRIFHEDIPIPGTDMTLHYASNRVEGQKTVITVPASGETIPSSLKSIIVRLDVAGRIFEAVLQPLPNQKVEYTWDGLDYRGSNVVGPVNALISLGFVYDAVYYSADSSFAQSFAQAGMNVTPIRSREEIISWKRGIAAIDHRGISDFGEGWTLSSHHYYEGGDQVKALHKGDGTSIIKDRTLIVSTWAGNGQSGYGGDGGPATQGKLSWPYGAAVDREGNIFIADDGNHRIRKVAADGIITTVAGNGIRGHSGDGGPATQAKFDSITGIAVDNAGSIYIADAGNYRIRKVNGNGIISTVAGNGSWGFSGDGGPAIQARLGSVYGVAADNAGNVYIADAGNYRIRKVGANGIITTVAGNGTWTFSGDGGPAVRGGLNWPTGVAVDRVGNLYIADYGDNRIRKVAVSGIITTVAGDGQGGYSGDGGPAAAARFQYPYSLSVDSAGNIYVADTYNQCIRKIDAGGIITTIVGNGSRNYSGDGGPATLCSLSYPVGAVADAAGNVFITDYMNQRIRKVAAPVAFKPPVAAGQPLFPDDNGMGYILSDAGLHQSTIDLATGKTLLTFDYGQPNRLSSITDRFGNRTTIQRNGSGIPLSVTSPYGHVTSLSTDAEGKLTRVTYPDNSFYLFAYTPDGLMTEEHDPKGNIFIHQYDTGGKIAEVLDPEGGIWSYSGSADVSGNATTSVLTAEGNLTRYVDHTDSTGAYTSVKTDSSGATTTTAVSSDGLTEATQSSCGMRMIRKYDLDPAYQYKYIKQRIIVSPAGLTNTVTDARTYQDANGDHIPDQITETSKQNGRIWTSSHDTLTGTMTSSSPSGRVVTIHYDPEKLLAQSLTIPDLHPATFRYDAMGRRTSTTVGSRTTSTAYDQNGNVDHITTPDGKTVTFGYDGMGRIVSETHPGNVVIKYAFDHNGNMTALTNPKNTGYAFDYTGVDQRKTMTMPLSGNYQYAYDRERKLKSLRFPSGKLIANTYTNGLLAKTTTPEGTTNYSYDCTSFLKEAVKGAEKITYAYDGSLLTADSRTGLLNQTITYSYNPDFRIASIDYAGGSQAFAYDDDGLLINAGPYTITRNAGNGLPEKITAGTFTIARTFSSYGEVDGIAYALGGNNKYSYSLTRDLAGRITQRKETIAGADTTRDYAYDSNGRLTEVKKDGSVTESYAYDSQGNRLMDGNRSYSYSSEDHLITTGTDAYQFNADGFLAGKVTSAGTTTTAYSSRGELLNIALPDGRVIAYDHDPMGRRIAKRINGTISEKYLWRGATTLLAVYDGTDQLVMRFGYAEPRLPVSMTKNGSIYYLVYDQIGSLRAVADGSGSIIRQIDYDSFGNMISDTNPSFAVPFGFAGGLHDRDTGLVRFGVRDYDPAIGRWTAKDPIDFAGGDVNLYGYVLNDPVNWIDPYGLDTTISLYPGAGGYGHIGIGVNTPDTVGLYPDQNASRIKIVTARDVPGVVHSDTGKPIQTITITTTPAQDYAMQSLINQKILNPDNYNLYERNCAIFVQDVLTAGGTKCPSTIRPRKLMDNLLGGQCK